MSDSLPTESILNAAGREVPIDINGEKTIPYQGVGMYRPEGKQASRLISTCSDFPSSGNKLAQAEGDMAARLKVALQNAGLKDGMTISTHHHFRNGDLVANALFDAAKDLGVKNLRWFPSASFPCHEHLLQYLEDGTIHHIEGSMNGPLGAYCSEGKMNGLGVLRSHGGRYQAVQDGGAAGVHLLVATQRPSTDVVTGLIKMNLPVRIAFKVTSGIDSRVILDESGADMLLGNGDFLYRPPGAAGMTRGQGAFVGEEEVRAACKHLREHGTPEFIQDLVQMKACNNQGGEVDDPLYEDAVRIILQSGRGSASLLQRALSIGYTRASRLIDIMSEQGVLGPFIGSKAREVQMTVEEWEARLNEKANA